ncbi:MAG: hypothetical protein V4479_07815 [Actinomycetota bacterium]
MKYSTTRSRSGPQAAAGVFSAALAVIVLVLGSPLTANAANYLVWFQQSRTPMNTWHYISTVGTYNGASVSGYQVARNYLDINGNVSQATGNLSVSFSYRTVNAGCKWTYPISGQINDLTCKLKY